MMYKIFFKRMIDIVLSVLAFPFFVLLYILVGIAIKIEDKGSIFYCGERLGLNLKSFKMYKFRSMKENSKDIRNEDGSTYNSDNDDRVTMVGKVIRKLSVDEIPQVINVLKGDMSFIGPRPSPMGNKSLYNENYLRKFSVRPGLSGYNQAYFRNDASLEEKQKNDLYYVDNLSLYLDFKIFIMTINKVIKREGINNKLQQEVEMKID
ncbi:sugar transferase [uncultured Ilyobacter sp.]|uniref:sugar transferase n=1 Tax=uncultured Ilyobacter sp. TaxID=544433 RepID=UPI0029C74951|nr:sugar transferase [uncultured Ilyobacter sp.]